MAKFHGGGGHYNDGDGDSPSPVDRRIQIVEPRCNVCKSAHRKDVDRYLAMGMSQAEVCRWYESYDATIFTRKSMSTHARKHLNLHTSAIRSIIETEARQILDNVDEVKEFLVTKRAALRVALQKGYEDMMSGKTTVEPDALLKIIQYLDQLDEKEEAASREEMMRDFRAFADAVKAIVGEKQWPLIMQRYEANLAADQIGILTMPLSPPLELEATDYTEEEGDTDGYE